MSPPLRAIASSLAGLLALTVAVAPAASADDPVVPSAGDVTAARGAAAEAARQEQALTARQAVLADQLRALQLDVARSVDAEGVAAQRLATATAVADTAAVELDRAHRAQVAAHRAVSAAAVQAWTHSGELDQLELALAGSPESMADAQVVLDSESARTSQAVSDAASTAAAADSRGAFLTAAREDQRAAAARATTAREGAEARAASARGQAAALAAEEADLSTHVDALRARAADVAAARAHGLAAQARARAAAKARAEAAARAARDRAARAGASTPVVGSGGSRGSGSSSGGTSPAAAQATARSLLGAHGWGASQFGCLVNLWNGESGWSWSATNPSSGAYGIPQALPSWKMATAGGDWLTDPATQIRWGLDYIDRAYGSPCAAWGTWQSRSPHWY